MHPVWLAFRAVKSQLILRKFVEAEGGANRWGRPRLDEIDPDQDSIGQSIEFFSIQIPLTFLSVSAD